MQKPAAGNREAGIFGEALRDLLLAAASPDNLDAFLRRIIKTLSRQDALGSGARLAVVLRPSKTAPPLTVFLNFTKKEQKLLSELSAAGLKWPKDLLASRISGGPAEGFLLAGLAAPASRSCARQLLEIAAKTISGRLAQESREGQLSRERDIADAITHLEELYLAFPTISLEEISRTVLDEARRLTGSGIGFIGYINPATGWLNIPAFAGETYNAPPRSGKELTLKTFKGLWGWVLKKKKPLLTNSAASDLRAEGLPGGHLKIERFAAAPAVSGKKLIGILALANPPANYPPASLDAVTKLARVYALMLCHKLAEQQRQADDAKYKSILDTSSDMVCNLTVEGKLEYASRAVVNYGYKPDEVLGREFMDFTHPADRARVKNAFLGALKTGHTLPLLTYRLLRKDGSHALVEMKSAVLRRPGATPLITCVFHDATARRRTAEQLAESEIKYRTIFDKANAAIIIADAATGIIVDANKDAVKLTGRPREELIGMNRQKLHPHEAAEHYQEQFNEHARKGLATFAEGEIVRKDGSRTQVQISTSALKLGGREVLQGIFHDVTSRRRAEIALRESEEKYRRIVENMGKEYFFYRHDAKGVFNYLSPSITSTLGYSPKEFYAHFSKYLTGNPRNKEVIKHTELSIRGIQQPAYEIEIYHKDGSIHWLEVTETPLRDPAGKITGVEGLAHDITSNKLEAKALQESETRYKALFEGIGSGILVADTTTKHFLYANPAMRRMFGYTEKEFTTLSVKDLHPKESLKHVISEFEAQARGEKVVATDLPCLRKDGTLLYANIQTVRLVLDGRDCLMGQFTDITESKRLQNILRESEEKYRALFETSRDALMIIEPPHWKYSQANNATLNMFGAPEESGFLKLTPWGISPKKQPDGRLSSEKAHEMLEVAVKTGSNYFEWEHKRLYGPVFTAEVLLTRVDIGEKQVVQACIRDISARKRMEELLRQSELRQQLAMSQINGVLWVLDNNLRFTLSRGQGLATLGLKPDQVVGMKLEEFMQQAGPDSPSLKAHRRALQGRNVSFEERINNTEFSIFLSPLRDRDQKINGVVGIALNITEKKRMESMLRENEETLSKIFDTTTDAIFLKDKDGRYLKTNKACADLFMIAAGKLLGKTDADLFDPEVAAESLKDDTEVMRQGRTLFFSKERILPSGKSYLSVAKTPLRGAGGEIAGLLGVVRDITEIKKMETELAVAKAADALSKVARPIAHDFNNALAAINGYATLIDDDLPSSSPIKMEISRIIEAVRRAVVITSKLQDFARNPKIEDGEK